MGANFTISKIDHDYYIYISYYPPIIRLVFMAKKEETPSFFPSTGRKRQSLKGFLQWPWQWYPLLKHGTWKASIYACFSHKNLHLWRFSWGKSSMNNKWWFFMGNSSMNGEKTIAMFDYRMVNPLLHMQMSHQNSGIPIASWNYLTAIRWKPSGWLRFPPFSHAICSFSNATYVPTVLI